MSTCLTGNEHTASRFAGRRAHGTNESHTRPIRVIVAEDSYLVREYLTAALDASSEVELVAICSDGNELRKVLAECQPDVVVTDIRIPPSGADEGIRAATRLRETDPQVGVVVLSQYAEPSYALALLDHGTRRRAYLLKERVGKRQELIGAIEAVARGGSVIDSMIVDVLIQARSRAAHPRLAQLTPSEREVLAEIAAGKSNAAIAGSLVLTKRAGEKHVNSILSKLDLSESHDVSRRVMGTLMFLSEEDEDPTPSPARRDDQR
jgi:DNA-binding NarL/FixJ family response regulator